MKHKSILEYVRGNFRKIGETLIKSYEEILGKMEKIFMKFLKNFEELRRQLLSIL